MMSKLPLQPPESKYTVNQWQAIHQEGNNLLLSASAGSGKTSVLVQRIMRKLRQGQSIKSLLVVTFTEAAAREMKERIEAELLVLVNQSEPGPDQRFFLQQIQDLPSANISTIDAFCRQVIQRYYYLIDLDPLYRLLTDQTELNMHNETVWHDLKEGYLSNQDSDFLRVQANFVTGTSDKALDDIIYQLYNKSRSHADPEAWLDQLLRVYDQALPLDADSVFYRDHVVRPSLAIVNNLLAQLQTIDNEAAMGSLKGHSKVREDLDSIIAFYRSFIDKAENSYQAAFAWASQGPPKLRNRVKRDFEGDDEAYEWRDGVKTKVNGIKERFEKDVVKAYFAFDLDTQTAFMTNSGAIATSLVKVVKEFIAAMKQYKEAHNIMDFADIELYSYQILQQQSDQAGNNEARSYYQERFAEIMIDEYQDVNALQEAILQTISREATSGNRFMVGDVKQSIYRFRFAEPSLFIRKYQDYADGQSGQRIILAENFRSRANVIDFTNFVFQQLMDKELGQISYDRDAQLKNGFKDFMGEDQDFITELLIYDTSEEPEANLGDNGEETLDFDGHGGQVHLLAQRIQDLISTGFEIYDKKLKAMRPVQYKDMVVLTKKRKDYPQIETIFASYGIPLQFDKATNYFQRTEIMIMMNALRLVDNPYQDIALASVLRSPLVGLSEPEMAEIRLANKFATYYDALLAYVDNNDSASILWDKVNHFKTMLDTWRDFARDHQIAELIWQIYMDTGYLDYASGMVNGDQRYRNLHGLYQEARNFEETAFRGLFQFIRFIELIYKQDNDLEAPQSIDDDQNAVRIMTVHGSKGLEFPLVFYLNISVQFNLPTRKRTYIANDAMGLGIKTADTERGISHTDLIYETALTADQQESLAEEMRLLYVALTRAEQKLFLIGQVKDWKKALESAAKAVGEDRLLITSQREDANSILDWLLAALIRHPNMEAVNTSVPISSHSWEYPDQLFTVRLYKQTDIEQGILQSNKQLPSPNDQVLTWQDEANAPALDLPPLAIDYAYQDSVVTTSYQSVSELKRLQQDPDERELGQWRQEQANTGFRYTEDSFKAPRFITTAAENRAAELGTATHLLMQKVDLRQTPKSHDLEQVFTDLAKKGLVQADLAEFIDFSHLAEFFETDIGHLLVRDSHYVQREESFSLSLPAQEVFHSLTADDRLLVHGTIDGFLLYDDHILLYDFKTDRVSYLNEGQQKDLLLDRYGSQLTLYAQALEAIWDRPVQAKIIIALENNQIFYI
ncbi:helicase-exonuclease AddAB subunit AddA [Aerococcus kribbianus]|uniref:ATP-dependent helicase/nuclease subunit A n=1 Tax=Aerococcus kribbianus TaxID=2999064 RepID=A0A9X3JE65_9LACT|nr:MULTISPECIES: helicase-exonuclease AddAB subunit AddA [unclassified Aerococcus]MCZ0716749.1 helicase-exonuclease AddAB subunit AddA [Aerococcus sp. YH-aer221]MCZ0725037.1 helicase-exonuclease AddAB subunit AddA [Aerococcus sp. YH-aer222]